MRLSITIVAAALCLEAAAIPAYPFRTAVEQPSGERLDLIMDGDEHMKYARTVHDGHTVVCDSAGYWRYLKPQRGDFGVVSNHIATNILPDTTRLFLSSVPEGLLPCGEGSVRRSRGLCEADRASQPVVGQRRVLIILAEFPDRKFRLSNSDFQNLFNQTGYSENGSAGSVADYFLAASDYQLELTSDVVGPFTALRNMAYYGRNTGAGGGDANPFALFSEALDFASAATNLKDYDCDGDGLIDNIHIIFAGYGEEAGASSNAIWSHEMTFEPVEIMPGLGIDRYSCSPELRGNQGSLVTTIGPPCHEICHALGAMDFYDTDYERGGLFGGTGLWDVMAQGSWNNEGVTPALPNPFVRAYDFQWYEPMVLNASGTYRFESSGRRQIYRVDTPDEGDYYLLDYHRDDRFSAGEPSTGLIIYHISPEIENHRCDNSINAAFPQHCYPVCASSDTPFPTRQAYSYGNINSAGCPFPGSSGQAEFSYSTIPAAATFDDADAGFTIGEITQLPDGSLSFIFLADSGLSPSDSEYCFKESFEKTSSLDGWIQEQLAGNASWTIESSFNSGIPHGKSYLKLSKKPDAINPANLINLIHTPYFPVKTGLDSDSMDSVEVMVSMYVLNNTEHTSSWTFEIENAEITAQPRQFAVESGGQWRKISFNEEIHPGEGSLCRLKITTEVASRATGNLLLDNIVIRALDPSAGVKAVNPFEPGAEAISAYNISGGGIRMPSATSSISEAVNIIKNNPALPRGIYIVRNGSSATKFIK